MSGTITSPAVNLNRPLKQPTEALLMPLADVVSSLVATSRLDSNAQVDVHCGDQHIQYRLERSSFINNTIPGHINQKPFELHSGLNMENCETHTHGETAAGDLVATVGIGPTQEMYVGGKAGEVPFNQTAYIGLGGVGITGDVGGQLYLLDIGSDKDGNWVGSGSLGERAVKVRTEWGPNGTILIHEEYGDIQVEKVLTPLLKPSISKG